MPPESAATPTRNETFVLSPWAAAARSFEGKLSILLALVGVLGAAGERALGFLTRLGLTEASRWSYAFWLCLAAGAAFFYTRELRKARGRVARARHTAFIGTDSFTESDQKRFFGRDEEIEEITRRLRHNRQLRFLILYGASGCGKTSLIRAGLIPKLESDEDGQAGGRALYVRLFNHPDRALRQTLSEVGAATPDATPAGRQADGRDAPRSLFDELRAAQARSGRQPFVLFVDQFEEFFTSRIAPEERQAVFEFVREVVGDPSPRAAKLVFSLRRDFFDRMTEFEGYVEDVFEQMKRKRIDLFGRDRAEEVIKLSLRGDAAGDSGGALPWSDALVKRVLDDLEIERRDGVASETEPIVLPAELQIVCQMVQRRRWSDAKQYTGKERLIRDYLSDALEASPNPTHSKLVLLAMIHENGITRSQPRTAREIAEKINTLSEGDAQRQLDYLDRGCRLVNQVVRAGGDGAAREVAYELAHEYLVTVINNLGGAVMDEARRANVALAEHRTRRAYNPKHRVPLRDAWRIRRHATVSLTAEDRQLLRRSQRAALAYAAALVLVPALSVAAIRYSTVHFAAKETVVVRRGLPFLPPLLGSDKTLVDTGLSPYLLSEAGRESCENQLWIFTPRLTGDQRWAGLVRQWYKDELISDMESSSDPDNVLRAAQALLMINENDERAARALHRRFIDNPAKAEWVSQVESSTLADALLGYGANRETVVRLLSQQINPNDGRVVRSQRYAAYKLFQLGDRSPEAKAAFLTLDSSVYESANYGPQGFDETRYNASPFESDPLVALDMRFHQALLTLRPDDGWLIEHLKKNVEGRDGGLLALSADALAAIGVERQALVAALRSRLRDGAPGVRLLAADRLLRLGDRGTDVPETLRALLQSPPHFWEAADTCVRHGIGDDWLRSALLDRLKSSVARQAEPPDSPAPASGKGTYAAAIVPFKPSPSEESVWAATRLIHLKVKDRALVDWLLARLGDPSSTVQTRLDQLPQAVTAVIDLGEVGFGEEREFRALRGLLDNEDVNLAGVAAASLLKLGARDKALRDPVLRVIEKSTEPKPVAEALKALHASRQLDQEALALVYKRLGRSTYGIASELAETLTELSVNDENTLKQFRVLLETGNYRFGAAERIATLALLNPAEGFEGSLDRLHRELISPAADRSSSYRETLLAALLKLAEQQLDRPDRDARLRQIRDRLTPLLTAEEIHRRVTAYRTLEGLEQLPGNRWYKSYYYKDED